MHLMASPTFFYFLINNGGIKWEMIKTNKHEVLTCCVYKNLKITVFKSGNGLTVLTKVTTTLITFRESKKIKKRFALSKRKGC